jgi:hypothetical protein
MIFSDYVIYVDESGDHSLESIDPEYPIFVLSFCIFKKADYVHLVVPRMQDFKFGWFGHDLVILHENDIAKKKPPFGFLQYDDIRKRFMGELTDIVQTAPMTIITAVIHKEKLKKRYVAPSNPYELALLFCLERSQEFIQAQGDGNGVTYVVCEARSELELEFRRIVAGKHFLQAYNRKGPMPQFDIVFASKQANSSGLQLADLIARPVGLSVLRPDQPNRAYEIIREKLWRGVDGRLPGLGLKIFP